MQDLIRERLDDSAPSKEGDYHVGSSIECSADADGSVMPDVYRPCRGTWDEFVGDMKSFAEKSRAEAADRVESARETIRGLFHRRDHQPTVGPKA